MILQQYYMGFLAHASYLLGDEAGGLAAWEAAHLPLETTA